MKKSAITAKCDDHGDDDDDECVASVVQHVIFLNLFFFTMFHLICYSSIYCLLVLFTVTWSSSIHDTKGTFKFCCILLSN